jgi:hypothetical protein
MTYTDSEALVEAMLNNCDPKLRDNEFVTTFALAYLSSFVASAMDEIPELKERVEKRILSHIKLNAEFERNEH